MLSVLLDSFSKMIVSRAMKSYRSFPAEKTAVLLLDTQASHVEYLSGLHPNLTNLLDMCKAAGIPIVYSDFGGLAPSNRLSPGVERLYSLFDAQYSKPDQHVWPVNDNDIVLSLRTTLSVFMEGDLLKQLEELGIEHLVFAGGFADLSVESSARHASELGFHTTVLADCCGATSRQNHKASLEVTLPRLVHEVCTSLDWFEAVKKSNPNL